MEDGISSEFEINMNKAWVRMWRGVLSISHTTSADGIYIMMSMPYMTHTQTRE